MKVFDTVEPIFESFLADTLCLAGNFSLSGKVSLTQYYTTYPHSLCVSENQMTPNSEKQNLGVG